MKKIVILCIFVFSFCHFTWGATYYFYGKNQQSIQSWENIENWWLDEKYSKQADRMPSESDDVIINSSYSVLSSDKKFIFQNLTTYSPIKFDLTVTGKAEFKGTSFFGGNLKGISYFYRNSRNIGKISGDTYFYDNASNQGEIIGKGNFSNSSENEGKVIGNANFKSSSINGSSGKIFGDAIFVEQSNNGGGIFGNASFYDSAYCSGAIENDAKFYVTSKYSASNGIMTFEIFNWLCNVKGNIFGKDEKIVKKFIFGTMSANYGVINGDAEFKTQGSTNQGTINGNAIFLNGARNLGTVNNPEEKVDKNIQFKINDSLVNFSKPIPILTSFNIINRSNDGIYVDSDTSISVTSQIIYLENRKIKIFSDTLAENGTNHRIFVKGLQNCKKYTIYIVFTDGTGKKYFSSFVYIKEKIGENGLPMKCKN